MLPCSGDLFLYDYAHNCSFVAAVKPGIYDVYVSSFAYDPKCMKVLVEYRKDRALVFQLVENKLAYTPMVE
jgi:hypothetical protein